ncbi:MAG: hypothetical protein WCJ40_19505, partial [Planctomycetota bacterium]
MLRSVLRSNNRRNASVYRAPRVKLFSQSDFLDRLEKRQLLASFATTSIVSSLDLNVANQIMTIASQGSTYTFTLSGGATNTWTGSNGFGFTGSGTATLTANLACSTFAVNYFNIDDSAANTAVIFGNSGANNYNDTFTIRANNTSNAVLFSGNTSFSGSNALTIITDGRVELPSASCLTMANGNLRMDINTQAVPQVRNFSGLLVNNATIQTTGNGTTDITARGGVGAAASFLNKGVAVVNGGKILGGTTGTMNITGYSYTGVDGGVQGQGVYVYNLGGSANSIISSIGANVSVTGYGANSSNTSIASCFPLNAGVVLGGMNTTGGTWGGCITSGGNGTVTITGYGGTLANQSASYFGASYGVYLNGSNTTITSGGAGLVTVLGYGGGANANTACGMGVLVNNGTITSGNNGSVLVNGTGCTTASSQRNHGVYLTGTTSNIAAGPGTGTTTVVGQAGGCGTITTNEGVYIDGGTITAFGSGNVTVTGNGSTAATSSRGIYLWVSAATPAAITSNGGSVLVTGYGGGTGTGANNLGVQIQSSTVTAGGLGSVTVLGYGGNNNGTGDTNYGVNVDSGGSGGLVGKITSSGGNVVVTGTGGGGAADSPVASLSKSNVGVLVNQGGYITAGGSGTVDVTGYGGGRSPGATGATNYGVQVSSANSTTANTAIYSYIGSSGGEVSVTGFGGGGSGTTSASSGWYNYGINVYQGGKITSGGNADVTVNGTGGGFGNSSSSSGVNTGVYLGTSNIIANLGETFATITSGGNGNVTITGQGGGTTGSGANNWGVGLQAGGLITSGGMGTVSITGVAGDSAIGNQNIGVYVQCTTTSNVSTTVTSGGGNVVVNGTGGGKNSQYNVGVLVSDGGIIIAPGTASVSVTGRGGNANSTSSGGTQAIGVWVYGSGAKQIRPKITSTNGTVTVTGYGGNSNTSLTSAAGSNYGVQVSLGGEISSGGTAPVTVTGNGGGLAGGTSTDNVGVSVSTLGTAGNLPAQITSSGGTITVTGSGGSTNPLYSGSGSSHGVSIAAGGQIKTTGSGTSINITGTGGGGNANGSATNHGILIAGCATLSNFTITSNGGPITLNATEGLGSGSRGITTSTSAVIGNATTSGNITILTNSANLSSTAGAAINSAASLLIAPITPGVSVTLGCTTDSRGGPLNLSAAELNTFSAGTIQLGNSSTGNFTVSANVTVPAASNLTLVSNSTPTTGIRSNATITMGAGKLLDVSALPSVNTQMNGTTALTQYSQLNVTGNLSIAGRSLNLYGSYTPVSGDIFTIANATSLTGNFTGLANGSTTTFNGRTLLVNYTPTTATLTEPTPKVTTQPTGSTVTAGTPVNFTSAATGIPAPDVQWQVLAPGGSWSNITSATSPTYSFNSASGDNGNQYRAFFTNTYGNATSSPVILTVQFAPSINPQPSNATITDGQTATFTAAATGNPTPTVQWQVNTGSGWADVTDGTGATTNSYTTAALTSAASGYQYRALYSNSVTANVSTNAATVTVNAGATAPTVTGQPSPIGVEVGQTASFTASASGSPTPDVKWQVKTASVDWTDIGGATSATYSFTAALVDQGNQFRAVFNNTAGTATTNPATLNLGVTPVITSLNYMTIPVGMTSGITVIATGSPAPQYTVTGNLPSGVTLDPVTGLFAGAPAIGTAGSYPVTIQALNGIGTAPTQSFSLTVTSTVTSFTVSKGSAQ